MTVASALRAPRRRPGGPVVLAIALVALLAACARTPPLEQGLTLYERGRYRAALEAFDQALRQSLAYRESPTTAAAYGHRGATRLKLGDVTGAIDDFSRSLALSPDQPDVAFQRGNAHLASGDLGRGIADFTRAAELRPEFGSALFNRGLARLRAGDPAGAQADWARALDVEQDERLRAQMRRQAAAGTAQASAGGAVTVAPLDAPLALRVPASTDMPPAAPPPAGSQPSAPVVAAPAPPAPAMPQTPGPPQAPAPAAPPRAPRPGETPAPPARATPGASAAPDRVPATPEATPRGPAPAAAGASRAPATAEVRARGPATSPPAGDGSIGSPTPPGPDTRVENAPATGAGDRPADRPPGPAVAAVPPAPPPPAPPAVPPGGPEPELRDPRALAHRALERELRGDRAGAIADLRAAIALESDPSHRASLQDFLRRLQ